jgi:quinoprotein glucose dehydrogenase
MADATDLTPELHAEALELLKHVRLGPIFTPPSRQGTVVRPGLEGGADWGGGAFDPETGVLYTKVNDDPALLYPDITDAQGNVPAVGPNDATDESLFLEHRIPVLKPPYAYLDALDLNRGTLLWQQPFGDNLAVRNHPALAHATLPPKLGASGDAGLLVSAGGLLFAGGGDHAFHAIDKRSGQDLWFYSTGELKTTGTPMTYRAGGRQFVVIAVGGPGAGATLLAFALPDGSHTPQAAPAAKNTPAKLDVEALCGQCHAFETITRTRRSRQQWQAQVDSMIAKGAQISDDDFDKVVEYLTVHYGPTTP